jgi:hypothetical protein
MVAVSLSLMLVVVQPQDDILPMCLLGYRLRKTVLTPHLHRYPATSTCEHLTNHGCSPPTSTVLLGMHLHVDVRNQVWRRTRRSI